MSLGIAVKGTGGLVLAAESRVTLTTKPNGGDPMHNSFDNATKLFTFNEPNNNFGVITYGQALIGDRTAHSFIPEFEAQLPEESMSVLEFSNHLRDFMLKQWNSSMPKGYSGPQMTFVIGGFDDGEPYGKIYILDIPKNTDPREMNPGSQFGITWGGQRDTVDRLIQGFDVRILNLLIDKYGFDKNRAKEFLGDIKQFQMPIPYQFIPLQDCVDLAVFFIETTIKAQKLSIGIRGCGGCIDVAIITRNNGLEFINKKKITAINM